VLIKQVLDLLDESRQALETGIPVPMVFFEKAGIFCSEFADRFHHFKEEFLLFGLLSYKKQGELDTAMGVLRYQHDRCKQSVVRIKTALPRYEENDEMAVTRILENLSVYVSLLHRHIGMEDRIFFPMAEKALSSEEADSLSHQFEHQAQRFGPPAVFHDKHQALAAELKTLLIKRAPRP
ncbi:MAG: hemerythrin domain-containing protein, partial [Desulfotignum sp.]|nr:hemerythrin domain-containing protein [Desulfotignum sp.]